MTEGNTFRYGAVLGKVRSVPNGKVIEEPLRDPEVKLFEILHSG